MRRIFLVSCAALTFAAPAMAQTASPEDDRSFLEGLLEDNLSDAGRDVRIDGFVGALSTQATIERLTIADDDGVWLRLSDIVLDWDRTALLQRRLIVQDLSVAKLEVLRKPLSAEGPSTTASGFSLPELPLSVDVDVLKIARIELDESVLGTAAVSSLSGNAQLADGEGAAVLRADRLEGPEGAFLLTGSYANESEDLALDLSLSEGAGGLVAELTGLPGDAPLTVSIKGAGPLTGYAADILVASDGVERVSGQAVFALAQDAPTRFGLDVGGDVSALILPQYRAFFGTDTTLSLAGRRFGNGTVQLTELAFDAQQLRLGGTATINRRGWPERANLTLDVAARDGAPVLLPIPGADMSVNRAKGVFDYDVLRGRAYTGNLSIAGLSQAGSRVDLIELASVGEIAPGGGGTAAGITGRMTLRAEGIAPEDQGLAEAIGAKVTGYTRFSKPDNAPGRFRDIAISGADYGVNGAVTLKTDPRALDVRAGLDLSLSLRDISRLSKLAGRDLSGGLSLTLQGDAALPGGDVDLSLRGTGRDLSAAISQLDPLFEGQSVVNVDVARDESGTRIEDFAILAHGAEVSGSANLAEGEGAVRAALSVPESRLMDAALSGPIQLEFTAAQSARLWEILATGSGPGALSLTFDASAQGRTGGVDAVFGDLTVQAEDIAPYRGLAGLELGGAVSADIALAGDLLTGGFGAIGEAETRGLRLGLGDLDRLVGGTSRANFDITRDAAGTLVLNALDAVTPEVTLSADGETGETTVIAAEMALRDLGVLVPNFAGAARGKATATLLENRWQIAAEASGPGGTEARVSGMVAADAKTANLSIDGRAPLGLANPFIAPRQLTGMALFDLGLNGPIGIGALSGDITTQEARASLPIFRLALDPIAARARLTGGRALVDLSAGVSSGGSLSVSGPVGLTAPFDASLSVLVSNVGITDPVVVDTAVNGSLTVEGPLVGGARVAGALTLDQAELRIPTSGFGTLPDLAGLRHVNEPGAVYQTRVRAGMERAPSGARGGKMAAYPLDLTVSAPGRVFIRGRGIDAELGGQIRLGGTTNEIVPDGAFGLIRGRIDFLGKRLTMVEASATMLGSVDPYIRAVAETEVDDVAIQVTVEGRASAPEITFTSNPDLPQDEILARLVFGRSLAEITPLQALQLANGIRTLAGSGDGGVTAKLRQGFGLADLDVTTDAEGNPAVKAGTYIGENVYTDVTVNSVGEAEVNINLDLTPNLTARGRLSSDGETGLGIYFEKDY